MSVQAVQMWVRSRGRRRHIPESWPPDCSNGSCTSVDLGLIESCGPRVTDKEMYISLSVIFQMVELPLRCSSSLAALYSRLKTIESQCRANERKYFPVSMLAICSSTPNAPGTRYAIR